MVTGHVLPAKNVTTFLYFMGLRSLQKININDFLHSIRYFYRQNVIIN